MGEHRVYLAEGKEIFEIADQKGGEVTKIGLAVGQSLIDFLDLGLDGGVLCMLFEQIGASQRRIAKLQAQMRGLMGAALDCTLPGMAEARLANYFAEQSGDKFEFVLIRLAYRFKLEEAASKVLAPRVITPVLLAESPEGVLTFLLQSYIEQGTVFKSCKSCGQFFVAEHGNADYCERLVGDSDKTCRDVGALKLYRNKQKQDPVMVIYNRAYKTHYARIKYKTMSREEFQAWGEEARVFRDEVLAGERELAEFERWARS